MRTPRTGHTANLLPSGRVLIAGRIDGMSELASVEIYAPDLGDAVFADGFDPEN
jgi:hypothetical protein